MEVWKDVVGHVGYQVSSEGRVRSIDRVIYDKNGLAKKRKGVVLRPCYHSESHPYPYVQLGRGKGNMRAVHRLVAEAFLGEPPAGTEVCHNDGNPENCRMSNLRYGTPKENQADRFAHKTAAIGEKHGMSRLDEEKVIEIKALLAAGHYQAELAKKYGVSQSQISMIKNGKRWSHL